MNFIKNSLKDLIHLNWTQDGADNFFAACKQGAKELVMGGFVIYGDYAIDVNYLGQKYKVQTKCLHDVPHAMYQATMRQVMISSGQIDNTPWEEHLLSAMGGTIPGIPETVRVEIRDGRKVMNSRKILRDAIKDCTTYDTMSREMRLAKESTHSVDQFFAMEEKLFVPILRLYSKSLVR